MKKVQFYQFMGLNGGGFALRVFSKKISKKVFSKKKVPRDIIEIHCVNFSLKNNENCDFYSAYIHTHTHGKLHPLYRKKRSNKTKERKGKGRGEQILFLLPRASPWIKPLAPNSV